MMRLTGAEVELAALREVAFTWLDSDSKPRMVLRPDATIAWMNLGAQRLIERCPALVVANHILRLADSSRDAQLHRFIEHLDTTQRSLAIKFEGEDSYCVFRGWRMPAIDRYCIEVRFSGLVDTPALLDFASVFGLTASEARTAAALYGGLSARDIADNHSISIDTVRSHIRQVYSKMGVSGREQLFRQLDAFRID
jgi:DNA-binding CsgD family transcriptional regulator